MNYFSEDLWMMDQRSFMRLQEEYRVAQRGIITPEIAERRRANQASRREKAVGIIPITGPIEARPSLFGEMLGLANATTIGSMFDYFMASDEVGSILFDIASPGGMVYNTPELANKIFEARGKGKNIIASVNPIAASGAYWIAAAADRIVANGNTSDVGSVGVIFHHVDDTEANAKEGLKITIVRSDGSPYKQDVSSGEPLTDGALEYLKERSNAIYSDFIGDLAKFRGTTPQFVQEHFGKGRLVDARSAVKAGMVDRIESYDSTLAKMATGRVRLNSERASDDWDAVTPTEARRVARLARAAELKAMVGAN